MGTEESGEISLDAAESQPVPRIQSGVVPTETERSQDSDPHRHCGQSDQRLSLHVRYAWRPLRLGNATASPWRRLKTYLIWSAILISSAKPTAPSLTTCTIRSIGWTI